MRTPWPVLSITGAYLIFVTKLGPQLMKNRKPFDLQKVIAMYNLYQMVSNMYLVSMVSMILPCGSPMIIDLEINRFFSLPNFKVGHNRGITAVSAESRMLSARTGEKSVLVRGN